MDQFHGRSMTNPRGGKKVPNRDKRKYECGGYFAAPKIGEDIREKYRCRGGNLKIQLKQVQYANVDVDKGRVVRAKIIKVNSTPDNRNYARQGLITKGSLLTTEVGEVVVQNRPSQHGVVNAKLVKK
ncbi:MAG: 30S ribosomal protein S8e [Candidatus Micrarchaeia archaeon]